MKKTRILGIVALISLVVLIGVPLLIPMESYRVRIEQGLGEALGRPVVVEGVNLSLMPVTGLTVHGVRVEEQLRLDRVEVAVQLLPLISGNVVIPKVRIRGGEVDVTALQGLAVAGEAEGEGPAVSVEVVEVRGLALRHGEKALGRFDADVALGGEHGFEKVSLRSDDEALRAEVEPAEGGNRIQLALEGFQLPLGPALRFDRLTVEATQDEGGVTFAKIDGEAYGGTLQGEGRLDWKEGWRLEQRFDLVAIQLEPLLMALGQEKMLAGRLRAKGTATLAGAEPAALAERPRVVTDFVVTDGVVYNADLEQAARNLATKAQIGGETPFDELKGHVDLANNDLAVTGLSITSEVLEASGKVKVKQMSDLDGVIDVGLKGAAMIAGIPLKVGGTVDEPSLRLTDEAIAGAGAGTAILGPGLGTAVGIKAGQFFKGIGKALGGDDKED